MRSLRRHRTSIVCALLFALWVPDGRGARVRPPAAEREIESPGAVLRSVESAFASGSAQIIRKYSAAKVFLNLFTGENGYYSAEQTSFILKNFFAIYPPVSFAFSSSNDDLENPYGVGTYTHLVRGRRESAQIFVSLTRVQNEWRVTQITIARR